MYLVLIAWFYVALMMALAEAFSPIGTVLGAIFTFLLYGVLPMTVMGYILNSPARRRHRLAQASSLPPDADSHSASHAVTSERKEL